jgi:hypothetical protein
MDSLLRSVSEKAIVIRMGSDPKPDHVTNLLNGDRPKVQADANRPEATNFLEVQ